MTDAEKEKIKLRAAYLNNIAVAIMVVGVVTPVVVLFQSVFGGSSNLAWLKLGSIVVVPCLAYEESRRIHKKAVESLGALDCMARKTER